MVELSGQVQDVWSEVERQGCTRETEKYLHPKRDAVVFVVTIRRRGVTVATGEGRSERQAFLAALIDTVQTLPAPEPRPLRRSPVPRLPEGLPFMA